MGLLRKAAHRYAASWGMGGAIPRESDRERLLREQTELLREQNRLLRGPDPRTAIYPLWRDADELRAAGAKPGDAASYAAYTTAQRTPLGDRREQWRRRYLEKHPAVAAMLFPDGIPGETSQPKQ